MTYAEQTTVEKRTVELKPNNDSTNYDSILTDSLDHAEGKINLGLIQNNIPLPKSVDVENLKTQLQSEDEDIQVEAKQDPLYNLINAANLYAAAFLFDTYYSSNDNISPTSTSYKKDADAFLQGYITIIQEGYNQETETTPSLPPVGSLVKRF